MIIKRKCSKDIKNLYSVIRNNDEIDIVAMIYAICTREADFKENEFCYTHQDIFYFYKRIKEIYGEEIKFQLLRFLEQMKTDFYLSYEDFKKQNFLIKEKNLIIEKEKNKIPQISNGFNSQFIVEKIFCFCEEEKERQNVRNK